MSDRANSQDWLEDVSSLLPALDVLQKLGYAYLTPEQALAERGGKRSKIVLESILSKQLKKLNGFTVKGVTHQFSDSSISKAVKEISDHPYEALYVTSEKLFDLLTLGKSFEEVIDGDKRSHDIQYIDWKQPENNVYHVTDEFEIERIASTQTRRPDIVLFINGIPLVVIEAKRPDIKHPIQEAISQHLRNHKAENTPHFFCMAQLLMAICQNDAKYGTTATPLDYWAFWKDDAITPQEDPALKTLVNKPLSPAQQRHMLSWRPKYQQDTIRGIWASGERMVSEQDRALYGMLQPQRLLDLIQSFIVFDNGVKKIARYHQYFAVQQALQRVRGLRYDGSRQGGLIWHTTGSGKSLTMVMLAKALALEPSIKNPKIVLVSDRIDLDDQLKTTFKNCGAEVKQAQNGRDLIELVNLPKAEIITTVINKFEKVSSEKVKNDSPDIFVLVDESHRTQYGSIHAKMRNVFPNACYIGFTGTPLLKKDKSTAEKFGGYIHVYSMFKAVEDKAVVRICYEGRDSEFRNTEAVDKWFERITKDLNDEQRAKLKRKFKSTKMLYESEARMKEIAYDIGVHFKETYGGTLFKGMLATSSKQAAITYKKLLDDFGYVSSEVIISAPDTREGHSTVDEDDIPEVERFWTSMMAKYGSPKQYLDTIIEAFKKSSEPQILIVVDKLLTGFDVPRNSVLYLDKRLKEHSILQAIARVNRLFANEDGSQRKDFGLVIDYRGIFGEMNNALDMYAALEAEGFDPEDVQGMLINVQEEIAKLPTFHASLWAIFHDVKNKRDTEAMQQWLYLPDRRDAFYDALRSYSKTLQLAISNARWQDETPDPEKRTYTDDLKYFLNLRSTVRQRYAETVDYSHYEKQICKMVLGELGADEVKTIIEQVEIFQVERFDDELEKLEGDAAKADVIASQVKKVINEKMDEDPALYMKLSELIEEAIENHRQKRLSDADYLKHVRSGLDTVQNQGASNLPDALHQRDDARAYYGVLHDGLAEVINNKDLLVELSLGFETIINKHKIRDWHYNNDIEKRMLNDMDDLVDELKRKHDTRIAWKDIQELLKKIIVIARHRDKHG